MLVRSQTNLESLTMNAFRLLVTALVCLATWHTDASAQQRPKLSFEFRIYSVNLCPPGDAGVTWIERWIANDDSITMSVLGATTHEDQIRATRVETRQTPTEVTIKAPAQAAWHRLTATTPVRSLRHGEQTTGTFMVYNMLQPNATSPYPASYAASEIRIGNLVERTEITTYHYQVAEQSTGRKVFGYTTMSRTYQAYVSVANEPPTYDALPIQQKEERFASNQLVSCRLWTSNTQPRS